jgi:hypothetical protein
MPHSAGLLHDSPRDVADLDQHTVVLVRAPAPVH